MKFRTIAAVVLAILVLSVAALAQTGPRQGPGQGRNGNPMARIAKQLGLSQDQVAKIGDITKAYNADVKAALQGAGTRDEKAVKVKALKDKAAGDIMAVLTPDQQAKAEKMHLTELLLNPRVREEARLMAALSQLNLTPDQKAKVKTIVKDFNAKAKAIRGNASLDAAAKRTQLMDARKSMMDSILSILTPEQQTKFKELMAQGRGGKGRQN